METYQIIALVMVAALAGIGSVLDEAQTHRPLVVCTLVGIVLGDIKTGIILGGTLEMMALGWMNVGLAMAPDTHQGIGQGIAIAVALAAAGQVLTIFIRTIAVFFVHKADTYAESGNIRGIEFMHISALSLQALRVALPTLAVLMLDVTTVQNVLNSIPEVVTKGLQIGGGIVVVVGYAMVVNMMNVRHLMPFLFAGFLIAAFTNFNLVGLGGMGLVAAIIYLQVNPRFSAASKAVSSPSKATLSDEDDLDS
jgi:PTS system mannose-specific IIC component